jgi:hypothetical protein
VGEGVTVDVEVGLGVAVSVGVGVMDGVGVGRGGRGAGRAVIRAAIKSNAPMRANRPRFSRMNWAAGRSWSKMRATVRLTGPGAKSWARRLAMLAGRSSGCMARHHRMVRSV